MKYFSVNQDNGVVWLRQQLDREVKTNKHTLTNRCEYLHIANAPIRSRQFLNLMEMELKL